MLFDEEYYRLYEEEEDGFSREEEEEEKSEEILSKQEVMDCFKRLVKKRTLYILSKKHFFECDKHFTLKDGSVIFTNENENTSFHARVILDEKDEEKYNNHLFFAKRSTATMQPIKYKCTLPSSTILRFDIYDSVFEPIDDKDIFLNIADLPLTYYTKNSIHGSLDTKMVVSRKKDAKLCSMDHAFSIVGEKHVLRDFCSLFNSVYDDDSFSVSFKKKFLEKLVKTIEPSMLSSCEELDTFMKYEKKISSLK